MGALVYSDDHHYYYHTALRLDIKNYNIMHFNDRRWLNWFSGWASVDVTANRGHGARETWVSAGTARTWLVIRRPWADDWARGRPTALQISTRENNWSDGRLETPAQRTLAGWAYFPRPNLSGRNLATTTCTWKTICHAAPTSCLPEYFLGTTRLWTIINGAIRGYDKTTSINNRVYDLLCFWKKKVYI